MAESFDPQAILAQLTTEEKITLLSAADNWHTAAIPRLNIPQVRLSDGPNGVRGTAWIGGHAASCTPCGTGLGSSFNVDLARQIGQLLGEECISRGVHCLLGPTTNIPRDPRGGRAFESYSEDPYHSGKIASAWLEGLHSKKVITTPKHYIANEQEAFRRSSNSVIDERALHEIYLEPFRLQAQCQPGTLMTSYNRYNGLHCSEHPELLRILREDFGFGDGLIISDWSGTYSSADAIKASLDLEAPGPSVMRGACVERDIVSGKLKVEDVDACVLRVLKFVKKAIDSGIPFNKKEEPVADPETEKLLLDAAEESIVLLKNRGLLPLKLGEGIKVAVIGPNAAIAHIHGGGSAALRPTYAISPLEGIKTLVESVGGTVKYALGADSSRWTPSLIPLLSLRDAEKKEDAIRFDFFSSDPFATGQKQKSPNFTLCSSSHNNYFFDGIPLSLPIRGWIIGTTTLTPDETGIWEIGLAAAGQADLYLDGERIIENSTSQKATILFFGTGSEERVADVHLEKGRNYQIEIRFSNFHQLSADAPYAGRRGGIRLGGQRKRIAADDIAEAVSLAKEADYTILVVGNTAEWESEAYDRSDICLPRNQNDLVDAVLDVAASKTVICHQSGMANELPWVEKAPTLLQLFFAGNSTGAALANVLFGGCNPSGRLSFTWPRKLTDYPAYKDFGQKENTVYREGIHVGYRYFDCGKNPRSLFPFGFGLSFTTFEFSDLRLAGKEVGCALSFTVTNTGTKVGPEVAQIYVHARESSVKRPEHELKAFEKVYLEPGQSQSVTITLDHAWIAEKSKYTIRLAKSSVEICLEADYQLQASYKWFGQQKPVLFE